MRQVCFCIQLQSLLWSLFLLPAVVSVGSQQVFPSEIQEFFKYLFFREDFGHTLFGQKPMSLSNYACDRLPPSVLIAKFGIRYFCEDVFTPWISHHQVLTGWDAWLLWKERSSIVSYALRVCEWHGRKRFFFVNKPAFIASISNHLALFEEVFPRQTPADVLDMFLTQGDQFFCKLEEREDLIGILLGFGVVNAIRFQKEELLLRWKRLTLACDPSIEREFPPISHPIRSIASYFWIVSPYSLGWKGDRSDEETAQLCLDYQKTQHFLEELSINPNWFLVVYQQLLSHD